MAIFTLRPPYSNGEGKNTPQSVRAAAVVRTASVRPSHTKHLVINTQEFTVIYSGLLMAFAAVILFLFLGMFAKLRKAAVSFVTSVCLSAWNNSAHTERIFMKFDI